MTNDSSEQKLPFSGEEEKRSVSEPATEERASASDERKALSQKETLRPVGKIRVSLPQGGEMATKHFVVPYGNGAPTAGDSQESVNLPPGKGEIQILFPGRLNSKGTNVKVRSTDVNLTAGDQLIPQNPKVVGLNSDRQPLCKADRKRLETERKLVSENVSVAPKSADASEPESVHVARESVGALEPESVSVLPDAVSAIETSRLTGESEIPSSKILTDEGNERNSVQEDLSDLSETRDLEEKDGINLIQDEDNWFVRYLIRIGETVSNWLFTIGDFAMFAARVFFWLLRLPRRGTLLPCMYEIGIMSLPVIALTGTFIGMVLAVQSYNQLKGFYLETRMGALINLSLVRELGPVLAATMLAGRIGSSMAAELGTMRVTEQIDALGSMGVNPIHYLVTPRFLACVLLIPVLTIFADFMGIVGGAYFSVWVYGIDWHFYLTNSNKIVGEPDIFIGIFKSFFFGATIGLIGCHRGFNSRPGAQGVGRASTEAFVFSFVFILLLDLALGTVFEALDGVLFTKMPRQL